MLVILVFELNCIDAEAETWRTSQIHYLLTHQVTDAAKDSKEDVFLSFRDDGEAAEHSAHRIRR